MESFFIWSEMIMYLDESGDLGFSLDLPNRHGGSSRYLTVSHICYPKILDKKVKRLVRDIMKLLGYNFKIEVKGSSLSDDQANLIAGKILNFIAKNEGVKIGSIIVNKTNVFEKLRTDTNILYNFTTCTLLLPYIKNLERLEFYPDKRSIKINRGETMVVYLKTKLYGEHQSNLELIYEPKESENCLQMWLADWITNFIWRHYEDGRSLAYNRLKESGNLFERTLYFE